MIISVKSISVSGNTMQEEFKMNNANIIQYIAYGWPVPNSSLQTGLVCGQGSNLAGGNHLYSTQYLQQNNVHL